MIIYIVIFLISVTNASVSQILLKKSANIERNSKIKEYLNKYVITSYLMLGVSTILTSYAYKEVNLGLGAILEAFGYIIVAVLSKIILKETLDRRKIIGIAIILTGIIIFAISGI